MKKILIIANKDALLTQEIAESFNLNGKYDAISAASIDVVLEYTDKQKAHLAGIVTDIILPETNDNLSPVSFDKEPNGLVIKKKAEELGIPTVFFTVSSTSEIVEKLIKDKIIPSNITISGPINAESLIGRVYEIITGKP